MPLQAEKRMFGGLKMNNKAISSYVNNLTEEGAKQALIQLLKFPDSIIFIENCILEFEQFYLFNGLEKQKK